MKNALFAILVLFISFNVLADPDTDIWVASGQADCINLVPTGSSGVKTNAMGPWHIYQEKYTDRAVSSTQHEHLLVYRPGWDNVVIEVTSENNCYVKKPKDKVQNGSYEISSELTTIQRGFESYLKEFQPKNPVKFYAEIKRKCSVKILTPEFDEKLRGLLSIDKSGKRVKQGPK